MLILFWLVLFLVGASLFIGAGVIWYYMAAGEFREPVNVICPETLKPAEVKVDGKYAAQRGLRVTKNCGSQNVRAGRDAVSATKRAHPRCRLWETIVRTDNMHRSDCSPNNYGSTIRYA